MNRASETCETIKKCLSVDFSSEAMEAKWHWDDISKVLKEKSIKKESDIQQNYSLKEKLRYFPKNKN